MTALRCRPMSRSAGLISCLTSKRDAPFKKQYGQPEQDILTTQMLEGTDGRKMSTSWGNVITIVDEPGDMFGKIMAINDELILKYFWLCADVSQDELDAYHRRIEKARTRAILKWSSAKRSSRAVSLAKDAEEAATAFEKVFSKKELPEDMPAHALSKNPITLSELLVEAKLSVSKSDAKRLVEQGAWK